MNDDPSLFAAGSTHAEKAGPELGGPDVGRGRRRWWYLAGGVAVVAVVVGIVVAVTSGGSGGSRSHHSAGGGGAGRVEQPSGYGTRPAACLVEVNVALDVTANGGSTYSAIGTQSPIFELSSQLLGQFEGDAAQYGSGEAENRIIAPIREACEAAGNPILTGSQESSLQSLAGTSDANALDEVSVFASGVNGH